MNLLKLTIGCAIFTGVVQGFFLHEFNLLDIHSPFYQWIVYAVVSFTLITSISGLLTFSVMKVAKVRAEWMYFSISGQIAAAGNSLILFVLLRREDSVYCLSFLASFACFFLLFAWYYILHDGTYSTLWRINNDTQRYDFLNKKLNTGICTLTGLGPDSFWATSAGRKADVYLAIILLSLIGYAKYSHSFVADHVVAPAIIGFVVAVGYIFLLTLPKIFNVFRAQVRLGNPLYLV